MHWTCLPREDIADAFASVPWGPVPLRDWARDTVHCRKWHELSTLVPWFEDAFPVPNKEDPNDTSCWQRASAEGIVYSLHALGAWGQHKQNDAFAESLHRACRAYEFLWGTQGASTAQLHVGDIETCLRQLSVVYPVGSSMVRDLLTKLLVAAEVAEQPTILQPGSKQHEVRLNILLGKRKKGELLPLRMSCLEDPVLQRPLWHPDAWSLGMVQADVDFRGALESAWAWATSERLLSAHRRVVWSIDRFGAANSLNGGSAGSVFAVGLLGLKENSKFDGGVVLTAKVTEDGQLERVEQIMPKAAAAATKKCTQLVLHPANKLEYESLIDATADLELIEATSVLSAAEWLRSCTREVRHFLDRLIDNGIRRSVSIRPDRLMSGADIASRCLRPFVVLERTQPDKQACQSLPNDAKHSAENEYLSGDLSNGYSDSRTEVDLNEVWQPGAAKRVTLAAPPGGGKTTALWLVLTQHCEQLQDQMTTGEAGPESSNLLLPLFLDVAECDTDHDLLTQAKTVTLALALPESQTGRDRDSVARWMERKIEAGQYVLYLDSVTEIAGGVREQDWIRNQIESVSVHTSLLATTRSVQQFPQLSLPKAACYSLAGLTNVRIRQFISNYFRENPQSIDEVTSQVSALPETLGPLVASPLLLATLCQDYELYHSSLPRNHRELLRKHLQCRFQLGDRRRNTSASHGSMKLQELRQRNDQKESVLRDIANSLGFELDVQRLRGILEASRASISPNPPANVAQLLHEFEQDGVLIPDGSEKYRFADQSVFEYFQDEAATTIRTRRGNDRLRIVKPVVASLLTLTAMIAIAMQWSDPEAPSTPQTNAQALMQHGNQESGLEKPTEVGQRKVDKSVQPAGVPVISRDIQSLPKPKSFQVPPVGVPIADVQNSLNDLTRSVRQMSNRFSLMKLELIDSELTAVDFVKVREYSNLRTLDLSGSRFDNPSLDRLPGTIEHLHLAGTNLNDEGLKALPGFYRLQTLNLGETGITDTGLKELGRKDHLTGLNLAGTEITDTGLKLIGRWRSISDLNLDDTAITGSGFEGFPKRSYDEVSLRNTEVNDEGLRYLSLLAIKKLDLRGTSVTDTGLKSLHGQSRLEHLLVDIDRVSVEGIRALKAENEGIRIEF